MKKLQVKLRSNQGKRGVNLFKIIEKEEIGKSLLIRFDYSLPTDILTIEYDIKVTNWDRKEKDYCIDLLMYDRSNNNFYIYPQASEVYIPMINAKEYFNILVKEVFGKDIEITGRALDRLFQTLKLTNDREERISYIKESIEKSIKTREETILGRLLYRDLEEEIGCITEEGCRIFEYKFTQNLINIIEVVNMIISDIESLVMEGLMNTNILIHKNLNKFFKTELWEKIKNIYGVYDKEFIKSGSISGLIPEMSMNVLFIPVVQEYLNLGILGLEELDKRYFEISNQSLIRYSGEREYCIKESDICDSMTKLLNLVDLLTGYEKDIFQSLPNLTPEELKDIKYSDYFNYKNNQLLTLGEFNKVKKFYGKLGSNSLAEKGLEKSLEVEGYTDNSLYTLPRKIPDLMVTIFNKYFV